MTESLGDDVLAEFLAGEAAEAQRQSELEAWSAMTRQAILSALDNNGAGHIWHPDESVMDENHINARSALTAVIFEVNSMEVDDAAELADFMTTSTLLTEIVTIGRMRTVARVIHYGVTSEEEELEKKKLLATLQLRGFDEGWQATVDELFKGDKLDLMKEADLQIYLAEVERSTDNGDPIYRQISEIVCGPDGIDWNESLATVIEEAMKAKHGLNANSRANFAAYLDQQVRNGELTESQSTQLLALV